MSEKGMDSHFHRTAGRIVRRLAFVNWLNVLKQSALIVFGVAVACLFSLRIAGGNGFGPYASLTVVTAWMALTALWAYLRKPSALEAYALWDEKSKRHEAFLSAYWFESSDGANPMEKLHIDRSLASLQAEAAQLRKQVPAAFSHRMWVAPALLVLLSASPFLKAPIQDGDKSLTAEDRQRAHKEADKLAKDAKELVPLKGLDEKEKKKAEALEKSMKETAEKLKHAEDRTKRDILEALDQQARQAEELAQALGGKESMDLSSGMLAELERHADTADMAAELRKKDPAGSARETETLAGRLRDRDLTLETEERIAKAFRKSMEAATEKDRRSLVGKHFERADRKLQKKMPEKAADDLSDLAKQFERADERQKSQKMLRHLAKKLRQSGQNLFGQNRGGMQRLPAGVHRLSRLSMQNMPALNQLPVNRGSPFSRPLSGLPQGMPQGTPGTPGAPTPGAPMAQGMPVPGQGMPIPGQGQCPGGSSRPGAGSMPGQGSCPGGGQGQMPGQGQGAGGAPVPGQGGGQGGLFAGVGSPGMAHSPTQAMKPGATEVVGASPATQGPSSFRNIQGAPHSEDTLESAKEIAIDFIKTEEDALSREPLPLSRQEQVLRYFTRLREQINKSSEDNQ